LPDGARTVLVTRPEPGGAETAARLRALGWQPLLAPALVLAPQPFSLPPCQAVLLTSRAAARALPPPMDLPLLAVGAATAAAARAAGWARVEAAEGTALDLARLAAARLDPAGGTLLLVVGQGYALDLAADLRSHGFRVLRRIAYAARPATTLPDPVRDALGAGAPPGRILFHSPRSAGCAITLFQKAGFAETIAQMAALVISPRVAQAALAALAPLSWRELRIAARPTEDALLALLGPAPAGPDSPTLSAPGDP